MVRQPGDVRRSLLTLAAVVIVLAGLKLGASFLGPLLLVFFFAVLCRPIYVWLRRRMPGGLALTALALLLVGIVIFVAAIVGISASQLLGNIDQYRALLAERLAGLQSWLAQLGVEPSADTGAATVEASAVIGAIVTIVSTISGYVFSFFYMLIAILFLVLEGPMLVDRFHAWLGDEHPLSSRIRLFGRGVVHYFGLRALLNAMTGTGVAIALYLLGIDFAALWGVLMFFLSFVPYIGIFIACIPPVVLAFAEFGLGRALLVIVGITIVNLSLENIIMPRMVGRGFNMPAFVVYVSFFWWVWLLDGPGALMGTVLTLAVAMLLDSFPATRGLSHMLVVPTEAGDAAAPAAQTPAGETPEAASGA